MFAYVDESGNTGPNLFDPNQPIYMTGAMMVREDFDQQHGQRIARIAASIGAEELHGNELGVGGILKIADAIADVLRSVSAEFYFCRVVKLHFGAGKFFDTFFDSGENVAVPWLSYNVRPLRLMLMLKVAWLLDEDLMRLFWTSLLELDKAKCRAGLDQCLRILRPRIDELPDARSREVLGEATDWALINPEVIRAHCASRQATYGHLPNMAAFPLLLSGIDQQSKDWATSVHTITHDEQKQFGPSLAKWHKMLANAAPDPVYMPLGEKHVMLRVPDSKFAIQSSNTSAGLQTLDVCLWCFKRMLDGFHFHRGCDHLMYRLLSRGTIDDISFATAEAAVLHFVEETQEPTEDQLEEARSFLELQEQCRRERMAEYLRIKNNALPDATE